MAHPIAGQAKASAKSKLSAMRATGRSGIADGKPFYGSKVITSDSKTRDGEDVSVPDRKAGGRLDKKPRKARKAGGRIDKAEGGGNWIAGATKNKGALHKSLGVPKGEKIPEKKLEKAEKSDNPKLAKRARLAETLKGLRKAKGGGFKPDADGDADGDIKATKVNKPGKKEMKACRAKGGGLDADGDRDGDTEATEPREARAKGGKVGKGAKINIMINPQGMGAQQQQPQPQPVPVPVPVPAGGPPPVPAAHVGPPPVIGAGGPPIIAPPQGGPPVMMPRKQGGRVPHMTAGAKSGPGRLEKAELAKRVK